MRNILLLLALLIAFNSCTDKRLQTFTANVPIYLSYEELRSSFAVTTGQEMRQPGKIYYMEPYLYINEYQEGIHVVDMSDPATPQLSAFISIPGNVDMAIRNNTLYADSYTDLVMVDINNPLQPELIQRVEKLFEYVIPPYDYEYPLAEIDQEKGVITGYNLKEITQEIHNHGPIWPIYYDYMAESMLSTSSKPAGSVNSYGVGGSMARFLTYDNYLYTLESTYKLKSIDISESNNPVVKNEQSLWGNVETLFISDGYMYVGTSNGMHILSLEEPEIPILMSTYRHITACDPVVVSGNRAYVTLRAGNMCGGAQNMLEVIDIKDKYDPKRMATFAMTEPYGLGIDNSTLFICEGEYGLSVYDAANPLEISSNLLAEFTNIHAYDVIPLSSFLFTIGLDGFYIYDYSDLQDIRLLGTIAVSAVES
ncbi:MAG: hypothetical protein GY790_19790 [Bacteroidetes bacterium]|nr:hypothetical protein [Bacteroidota bacterium]